MPMHEYKSINLGDNRMASLWCKLLGVRHMDYDELVEEMDSWMMSPNSKSIIRHRYDSMYEHPYDAITIESGKGCTPLVYMSINITRNHGVAVERWQVKEVK